MNAWQEFVQDWKNFLSDPLNPRLPVGNWVDNGIDWAKDNIGFVFSAIEWFLTSFYTLLLTILSSPIYLIMIVVFALVAWLVSGWKLAVFTVIGFYLIRAFNQWDNAMMTLALVTVAVLFALLISIPLGILAAKSNTVSRIVKPVLDLMQTLPALVYLVPAITIFSVGPVPGAISTLIFALPPGVRLTELGIRGVDREVVEAGQAFGSSPGRILRQIQLPLALPTIMAGVNQVIMLALSMVVLAGMAGSKGLGGAVVESLATLRVPVGIEAGLAVVIIAIFLDRLSASIGSGKKKDRWLSRVLRPRPKTSDHTQAPGRGAKPADNHPSASADRSEEGAVAL